MKAKQVTVNVTIVTSSDYCDESCQFLRESGNGSMAMPERRECLLFHKRLSLDWKDGYIVTRCEQCLALGT